MSAYSQVNQEIFIPKIYKNYYFTDDDILKLSNLIHSSSPSLDLNSPLYNNLKNKITTHDIYYIYYYNKITQEQIFFNKGIDGSNHPLSYIRDDDNANDFIKDIYEKTLSDSVDVSQYDETNSTTLNILYDLREVSVADREVFCVYTEDAFLKVVLHNKDKLKLFILNCLRYLFNSQSNKSTFYKLLTYYMQM